MLFRKKKKAENNLRDSENLEKWREYYYYSNKVYNKSIEDFFKQDEKVNSLLLFHSVIVLLLLYIANSTFEYTHNDCVSLHLSLIFLILISLWFVSQIDG